MNVFSFKLTLNNININITSNDVPLEGLGHRLVVAAGDLQHEVLVEVGSYLINGVDSRYQLVLLLSADIEDSVGVLAPLGLNQVPYFFNRIQLTALRREELAQKPSAIELLLDDLAVVDAEVVHHHDTLMQGVDLF